MKTVLLLACTTALGPLACALDNGAARLPPLGWSQWNAFEMNFNATLFREVARALKDTGLQAAGYTLINVGGNGHAVNGSNDPAHSSGTMIDHSGHVVNCTAAKGCYTAVRNSTGHYQISAARFPGPGSSPDCLDDAKLAKCMGMGGAYGDGPNRDPAECGCKNGNEGMRALANELRTMGFQWGSYNAMNGCDNEACNIPALAQAKAQGFVLQDYELFVEEWGSVYVMVRVRPGPSTLAALTLRFLPPYPPCARWTVWQTAIHNQDKSQSILGIRHRDSTC